MWPNGHCVPFCHFGLCVITVFTDLEPFSPTGVLHLCYTGTFIIFISVKCIWIIVCLISHCIYCMGLCKLCCLYSNKLDLTWLDIYMFIYVYIYIYSEREANMPHIMRFNPLRLKCSAFAIQLYKRSQNQHIIISFRLESFLTLHCGLFARFKLLI